MKHALYSILLALVLAGSLAAAPAVSTTPRIATVDLKKMFDGYWKTKQANENLKNLTADMDKERLALTEKYKKADEDYKKLLETANDQAVSGDEREKRKKSAEDKLLEIRQIEQAMEQFMRNARANLSEQERRMRDNLVKELRDVINSRARLAGFTLVLDISGETSNSAPSVLYTSGENDLTDSILAELNAKAPAAIPAAPSVPKSK